MTQSGNFKFHTPIFRVNNRQENIDFYQNTLGFKLLTEENALAVFTDWTDRNSLFVIEESPAYRCRAVEGPKKINKVVIKVSDPLEIDYLLARDDHQAKAIFQGEKGYAFETISPENGLILMHAEDDLSTLKTVEYADVEEKEDFKGVSDFTVESLTLNVVDTADQTWDLEILEFKVAEDYDLVALHDKLEKEQFSSYLDNKGNLLALTDMSNIEVWLTK